MHRMEREIEDLKRQVNYIGTERQKKSGGGRRDKAKEGEEGKEKRCYRKSADRRERERENS